MEPFHNGGYPVKLVRLSGIYRRKRTGLLIGWLHVSVKKGERIGRIMIIGSMKAVQG